MEGLEALKRIRQETAPNTICGDFDKEECCNTIEKELKDGAKYKRAVKIIHEREVVTSRILEVEDANEYNSSWFVNKKNEITQEEFDLFREVLK